MRLPFVAPVAADAAELTARIAELETVLAAEKRRAVPSQIVLNEGKADVKRMRAELAACHADALAAGAAIADAARGIVDFPGEVGGAEALLCWRPGDERVEHWHRPGEEHDARRPVSAPVLTP